MGSGPDTSGLATLYVGDLHSDVNETILQEKFMPFGAIAMIHVCRDSVTRRSLGYAYVNFYSRADAQQALEKLNYTDIRGRACRIMWNRKDRGKAIGNPEANIFVKNLDPSVDSRVLYETFTMFGNIISCKVSLDSTGMSRGYGFVQYESEDAAKQAIERVNGQTIGGRQVYVGPFIKRDKHEDSQGGEVSVHIRNIPPTWDDEKVVEIFREFGEVVFSLVLNDSRSDRRYGFVNFKDAEAAAKAIEALHGKDLRTDEERAAMEEEESKKKEAQAEEGAAEGEAAEKDEEKEKEKEKEGAGEEKQEGKGEGEEEAGKRTPVYCLSVSRSKTRAERDLEANRRREAARPPEREGIKLVVRNLPVDVSDDSLKALFSEFGTVTDIKAVIDRPSGECKGYGFVRLSTTEQANAAVAAMNGKEVFAGQAPLNVSLASEKGKGKGDGKGKGKGKGKGGKGFFGPGAMGGMPFPGMYPPMHPMGMPPRPMYTGMPMSPYGPAMGMMGPRPGAPMGFPGMPGMPGYAAPPPAPVMPTSQGKQMLGERLYPLVARADPQMAGKITGMLLEMDEAEIFRLLDSEPLLAHKIAEARAVLSRAQPSSV